MFPARRAIGHRSLIYTGIGSRQTPEPILHLIALLARELAARGWLLRSGGSPGADTAFEKGCDLAGGSKEIYLPWRGFNGSASALFDTPDEAMTVVLKVHPDLRKRTWLVRKLRTRNVCQLLGQSLNKPSDVVIAWTEVGVPLGGWWIGNCVAARAAVANPGDQSWTSRIFRSEIRRHSCPGTARRCGQSRNRPADELKMTEFLSCFRPGTCNGTSLRAFLPPWSGRSIG